jgi:CheY-like chemotaxis protein
MAELSHVPRILLVEDDGLIALDIETTLEAAGATEVTSKSTVEDALLALESPAFDAAVLDLHLGRNGWTYDVAQRLRELGIPFVLSSGTSDIADGFRDVPLVMKPFSSDQLIGALCAITGRAVAAE